MLALLFAAVLTAQAPRPATNTICPVLGNPTDASSATVVVRGQAYRYCCGGCPQQLLANPDKYLNKDGTPRNAK